jgi:protein-tyrosine kinase
MSRVHKAIRKAEQESKTESIPEIKKSNPLILEIQQQLASGRPVQIVQEHMVEEIPLAGGIDIESEALDGFDIPKDSKLTPVIHPKSIASEQYRSLKARLYRLRENRSLKSLLITSVASGDGKTLTSVNLALTLAQEISHQVLLVDADLRKPNTGKLLGLKNFKGLADLLQGEASSSEIILKSKQPNLFVVVGGQIPENPAELLNTQKMRDFVVAMVEQYDWVIFDSPPLGALADAELIATLVDGTLLVVRSAKTPSSLVKKNLENLKKKNLLGIVFNSVKKLNKSHYYYYGKPEKKA